MPPFHYGSHYSNAGIVSCPAWGLLWGGGSRWIRACNSLALHSRGKLQPPVPAPDAPSLGSPLPAPSPPHLPPGALLSAASGALHQAGPRPAGDCPRPVRQRRRPGARPCLPLPALNPTHHHPYHPTPIPCICRVAGSTTLTGCSTQWPPPGTTAWTTQRVGGQAGAWHRLHALNGSATGALSTQRNTRQQHCRCEGTDPRVLWRHTRIPAQLKRVRPRHQAGAAPRPRGRQKGMCRTVGSSPTVHPRLVCPALPAEWCGGGRCGAAALGARLG